MHILIMPSWYIGTFNQLNGSFIREQAKSLRHSNCKIGVIYNNLVYFSNIINHRKMFRVRPFYLNDDGIPTYINETLQIPQWKYFYFFNKILRFLNSIRNLSAWLLLYCKYVAKHGKPDIVHVHSFYPGKAPIILKKIFNINYVITEHWSGFGSHAELSNKYPLIRSIYSSSNCIIAVSDVLSDSIYKYFGKASVVIPNSINFDFFQINNNKFTQFTFVAIGYLHKRKQFDLLINAFKKFDPTTKARLIIIGNGPLLAELKELSENSKVEIVFMGSLGRNEVREVISRSHVLVSSSFFETFGMTLIEAMASGLPVVSTKSGGPQTIISNDSLGILCDHNVDSIFAAINKIYLDHALYDPNVIRESAFRLYSENAVSEKLLEIYRDNLVAN